MATILVRKREPDNAVSIPVDNVAYLEEWYGVTRIHLRQNAGSLKYIDTLEPISTIDQRLNAARNERQTN
jgi:hypothetical protein